MCSISGGLTKGIRTYVNTSAEDRGRDDFGMIQYGECWISNHRATPTTEVEQPIERQPVGNGPWFVFNGIISNDKELGIREGEADTSVLPRILNTETLESFRDSLYQIKGSFAIAVLKKTGEIYLACNYKPIWIEPITKTFSSLKAHFPPDYYPIRMEPYSVLDLNTMRSLPIERRFHGDRAIVIASSGLDSTAVASYAKSVHSDVLLLHYDYGCRASKRETERIKLIADYLKCDYKIVDIPSLYFGGKSPLLDSQKPIRDGLPGAEYAHEWVPARNLVMLSLTTAFAESNDYGLIYLGTNLEEAGAYPDNEEQFILDFNNLLYGAVQEGLKIEIRTPLGGLMKHEIVKFGMEYGAPFHLTWSCYRGGKKHCGNCGPCFMRREAFKRNGLIDPVEYEVDNG